LWWWLWLWPWSWVGIAKVPTLRNWRGYLFRAHLRLADAAAAIADAAGAIAVVVVVALGLVLRRQGAVAGFAFADNLGTRGWAARG
jgi:hypothetical protein